MARRRVAVTGLGLVSPFGRDVDDFFQRMLAGESCVRLYASHEPPKPIATPAVHCDGFDGPAILGKALTATMDRFSQLATVAGMDAWRNAGLATDKTPKPDCGVAWGTGVGGMPVFDRGFRDMWQSGKERLSPLSVVLGMNNAAASHLAMQLGLGNSCLTYSVACSSAAAAIGEAFRRIREGEATVMLTGGGDATLSYGVIRAWEAMRVLAPGDEHSAHRACRPFSRDRAGLVLGEGAAALVLEDWDHAVARGAPILAELAGYGATCDHSHLVRPHKDGQVRAIRLALQDGGLAPGDVGYVNAHGTATPEGDPIEVEALREVFGELAEALPVSATKSLHGHLMGAAGAIEALISVLALQQDAIPPTGHLDDPDPACNGVRHVTTALRGTGAQAALSNSFAFGGSNAVLAFRAVERP